MDDCNICNGLGEVIVERYNEDAHCFAPDEVRTCECSYAEV